MARTLELDRKSRNELVEEARALRVERPERLTRVELVDEIIRRTTPASGLAEARGLFGVARSMLASVVESGLNLPEAASVIRGNVTAQIPASNHAPVATVTLAEIYSAQGHKSRALRMLDEVLKTEPDHQEALRVKRQLDGADDQETASSVPTNELKSPVVHEPGATPEYLPAGFVETTGEEIKTGKPPVVAPEVRPFFELSREETTLIEHAPVALRESVVDQQTSEDLDEPTFSPHPSSIPPATPDPSSVEYEAIATPSDPDEASGVMERPSEVESPLQPTLAFELLEAPALVIRVLPSVVRLYWELPHAVLEQCGVDRNDGAACLRLVTIIPSGNRPQRVDHTYDLDQGHLISQVAGWIEVDSIAGLAAIRAALGWRSGDLFLPICVGKSVEQLGSDGSAQTLLSRAQQFLED